MKFEFSAPKYPLKNPETDQIYSLTVSDSFNNCQNGHFWPKTGHISKTYHFGFCDHEIRIQRAKIPLKTLKLVNITRLLRQIHLKTAKMAIFWLKTGHISKTYHFGVLRP